MRVPLSWLREYVDFDWSPEELARNLTALGMEVQSIEVIGGEWQNIVVGELLEVQPHPTAGRLSLAKVSVSDDEEAAPMAIVCGATNIAVGQHVPVALVGSTLPGGRQIGVTTIQGVESNGMLCSGAELGLSEDADGILILDESAEIGAKLEDVVGEVVLDVDVKPNRGDALSLIGLAREVAALTGGRVRWPAITVPESGDSTQDHLSVEVSDPKLCPRFVGRWVDEVKIGPSPLTVRLRLTAAGMRPVSNVVDASNYVMLELGKPIHAFDAAVVSGSKIVVRRAHPGETIETLDHIQRTLTADTLLIADPEKALGIAGVMGGAGSEVSEATTTVVVESAVFDPVSIRRTARRYALRSEASLRFEKGQESRLARVGADRTAQLIAEWAGGRVAHGVIDTNPVDEPPRRVKFRPARVNRLLGVDIGEGEMRQLLERVGVTTEAADDPEETLVAIVPPHRRDIVIEPDVTEEIARVRGYETIPPRLPDTPNPAYRTDPRRFIDTVRVLVAGRGLTEVVTNGLISPEDHALLGYAGDAATIRISNPVAADHNELRRSLLPGLLRVVVENERQRRSSVAIFEVGPVHSFAGGEPVQRDMLGLVLAGEWQMASWVAPAREAEVADVKGILEVLATRLHVGRLAYEHADPHLLVEHGGRTSTVLIAGADGHTTVGRVGELDPRYLRAYDVRAERVAFALIELDELKRHTADRIRADQVARLPAVERDVAVVIKETLPQRSVDDAIRAAAGDTLVGLNLFDRYQGPPMADDEVSLAYRLRFQPGQKPFSENELDDITKRVAAALERSLGARIRGADDGS